MSAGGGPESSSAAQPGGAGMPMPPSVHVPMRSRRVARARLMQSMQHAVPAVPLLGHGISAIGAGAHGFELWLAVVSVLTSAFLLVTIARAVKAFRKGSSDDTEHGHTAHGVDWAHVWSAGVLFAEAGERYHLTHHIARPTLLTAFFTLGLGIFHGRIVSRAEARLALHADESGIRFKQRFRRANLAWGDIQRVTIAAADAQVVTNAGKAHRIDLKDLENADDVRRALEVIRDHVAAARPHTTARAAAPPAASPSLEGGSRGSS